MEVFLLFVLLILVFLLLWDDDIDIDDIFK